METEAKSIIPRWMVIVLAVLAAIGLADATYLTIERFLNQDTFCIIATGCDQVLTSQYATLAFGIPVSLVGVIYYAILLGCVIAYWRTKQTTFLSYTALVSGAGLLASIYFVFLQIFVIKALCFYCIISATTTTIIFILSLIALKRAGRKDSVSPTGH